LDIEQVLDMHGVRLRNSDHDAARGISAPIRAQLFFTALKLDSGLQQHIAQSFHSPLVLVVGRDDPTLNAHCLGARQGALGSIECPSEEQLRFPLQAAEQRTRKAHLVIDDVADTPPTARPRIREAIGWRVSR
jgi:hypothetical protein